MVFKIVTVMIMVMQVSGQSDGGCNCGIRKDDSLFTTRISGGEEAEINEFPWAALLEIKRNGRRNIERCGGTLINDK